MSAKALTTKCNPITEITLFCNLACSSSISLIVLLYLSKQISTAETSNLGAKTDYMIRLLDIVKTKAEQGDIDIMMKFTLSALWNLTGYFERTFYSLYLF